MLRTVLNKETPLQHKQSMTHYPGFEDIEILVTASIYEAKEKEHPDHKGMLSVVTAESVPANMIDVVIRHMIGGDELSTMMIQHVERFLHSDDFLIDGKEEIADVWESDDTENPTGYFLWVRYANMHNVTIETAHVGNGIAMARLHQCFDEYTANDDNADRLVTSRNYQSTEEINRSMGVVATSPQQLGGMVEQLLKELTLEVFSGEAHPGIPDSVQFLVFSAETFILGGFRLSNMKKNEVISAFEAACETIYKGEEPLIVTLQRRAIKEFFTHVPSPGGVGKISLQQWRPEDQYGFVTFCLESTLDPDIPEYIHCLEVFNALDDGTVFLERAWDGFHIVNGIQRAS